ncbi:glutathione peroxidase [Thalassotalea insulae]|uniref:Glutathione peroxidase n=1 Tax=Thalassotalea insulae TaxID=2056778 RepID=A0ABQ6GS53_9GAMM|nr:glutathione peroxidase [Thalassotalea insulae]GLX78783.1 glutathione peroxidase [Thalassotalea insulae]
MMKSSIYAALFLLLLIANSYAVSCPDYLDVSFKKLHSSQSVDLCQLTQGKPVLIVNTASHCGYTPHFKELEAIHQKYHSQGLVVIGFPSDDFFQEEDDEAKTAEICFINYGVTFTMLTPTAVWGGDVNSVFKFLAEKSTSPKWNFYKYLIDGKGQQVQVFSPRVAPDDERFISAIESLVVKK